MIKKTFPILLAITILVAACSFTMQTGGPEWWLSGCDGFPPLEEVSQVLKEQEKLIERLQEEGLIHSAGAATCGVTPEMADTMLAQGIPPKGFIILYRLESQTKVLAASPRRYPQHTKNFRSRGPHGPATAVTKYSTLDKTHPKRAGSGHPDPALFCDLRIENLSRE